MVSLLSLSRKSYLNECPLFPSSLPHLPFATEPRMFVHAKSLQSCTNSLWPHRLQPARLLCPRDFPGKNTGVGCHAFLLGIFPTQDLNPFLFMSAALAGRFFTTSTTWEARTTLTDLSGEEIKKSSFSFPASHFRFGSVPHTRLWLCFKSYPLLQKLPPNTAMFFMSACLCKRQNLCLNYLCIPNIQHSAWRQL